MAKNTGKEYEKFVKTIQETILNLPSSYLLPKKRMTIELNKIINGREFDLYWEFEYGGITYRNVIECKDYASNISAEKIDAFLGKTRDIPDLRLIYATKTGYQSGAIERAEKYSISLLIVKGYNDTDFVTEDGCPAISQITANMITIHSPEMTSFTPIIDASWVKSQSSLNIEQIQNRLKKGDLNINIFISNKTTGERYSIMDLANTLAKKIPDIKHIENGTYREILENAFIELTSDNFIVKIKGFNITYNFSKSFIKTSFNIDLRDQILGIMHNHITGKKQMIFRNGTINNLN